MVVSIEDGITAVIEIQITAADNDTIVQTKFYGLSLVDGVFDFITGKALIVFKKDAVSSVIGFLVDVTECAHSAECCRQCVVLVYTVVESEIACAPVGIFIFGSA